VDNIIKKKRGRKPKERKYFGELQEEALIRYIKTDSIEEKHNIYNNILREPFKKMTSSILRTYNHHIGNYDIMGVELDGLSHLIENMTKFRPYIIEYQDKYTEDNTKWFKHRKFRYLDKTDAEKKLQELINQEDGYNYKIFFATAYAYCGTIVRNFYKDHSKNSRKEIVINQSIHSEDFSFDEDIKFSYEMDIYKEEDPVLSLFNDVIQCIEITLMYDDSLTDEEIIVGNAIIEIFKNWEILFLEQTEVGEYDKKVTNNFTKNKILYYLKEITNMDMKEIRLSMKKFRELYTLIKEDEGTNIDL
jgi:hypothetical protein